jgi:hypothetical protein
MCGVGLARFPTNRRRLRESHAACVATQLSDSDHPHLRCAFSVWSELFPRVPLWETDRGSYASTNVRMAGRASALVARPLAGIALATSLALPLACSSGSPNVPITTTSTIVVTTSRTSTAPSITITTSTATTTTAPTTTTTVDRASKAEADVRASVKAATEAFGACLLALPKCDVASLAQTRRGRLLELNSARLSQWNQEGYAVREREKFRYVIESVTVDPDGKRATANVCVADGSKLVKPGAAPDGSDIVVDGAYTSGREAWDVRLDDDGVWRPYDAPAVGPVEAKDVCPAA